MSNSLKNYAVDPAILTPQALAGKAQLISDPGATWITNLLKAINLSSGAGAFEKLDTTATSLDVSLYESRLVVSGTMAFTLPNGTQPKQRKKVICESAAAIPAATLTVTTPDTTAGFACSSTFVFDTAGQAVEFVWMDDLATPAWRVAQVWRAGVFATTPDTTVMTGRNLYALYTMAISGTIEGGASGATKKFPNGNVAGEFCMIGVASAAAIPHGSWDGAFMTAGGVAGTGGTGGVGKLADFAAPTTNACITWNGVTWVVTASIGGIVAS